MVGSGSGRGGRKVVGAVKGMKELLCADGNVVYIKYTGIISWLWYQVIILQGDSAGGNLVKGMSISLYYFL